MRSSGNIVLPHNSTIKRVCATHDESPLKEHNEKVTKYMTRRASLLKQHEKNVTLMLDEIHLQQFFDYQAGRLTGASVKSTEPATTSHVFMVQSLLSSFKDVAHILPVSKITAEELHKVLRKVIISLEDANLHVATVITDNSITRKVMSLFAGGNNFKIVANPQKPLFHTVNTVHLLKWIRNNWVNQKNSDNCLYYPHFDSYDKRNKRLEGTSFTTLRKLHEAEQNSIVKVAYELTYKALNPSNLERQKVKLALKNFNTFVSSALRIQRETLHLVLSH